MVCSRCKALEKLAKLQDKLDKIADIIPSGYYLEECNNNSNYYKQITARVCECENEVEVYILKVSLEDTNITKEYFYNEETGNVYETNYSSKPIMTEELGTIKNPCENWLGAGGFTYICNYNDIIWN